MVITQLLNKIGGKDFAAHEIKLLQKFRDIYANVKPANREEFIRAIGTRLVSRAKTCRNTGHIFAKLYKSLSNAEFEVSSTTILRELVLNQCM